MPGVAGRMSSGLPLLYGRPNADVTSLLHFPHTTLGVHDRRPAVIVGRLPAAQQLAPSARGEPHGGPTPPPHTPCRRRAVRLAPPPCPAAPEPRAARAPERAVQAPGGPRWRVVTRARAARRRHHPRRSIAAGGGRTHRRSGRRCGRAAARAPAPRSPAA